MTVHRLCAAVSHCRACLRTVEGTGLCSCKHGCCVCCGSVLLVHIAAPFAVFLMYVWGFFFGGGGGGGKGHAPHACGGNFAIPVTWAGNVHVWFWYWVCPELKYCPSLLLSPPAPHLPHCATLPLPFVYPSLNSFIYSGNDILFSELC